MAKGDLYLRNTSWLNWDEWENTVDCLKQPIDDSFDPERFQTGVQFVLMWMERQNCPLALEIYAKLKLIVLDVQSNGPNPIAAESIGMLLTRFVNGVTEPQQRAQYALSVQSIASTLGLPPILTELRHAVTHRDMPPLETLLDGAVQALDFIEDGYITRQQADLVRGQARVEATIAGDSDKFYPGDAEMMADLIVNDPAFSTVLGDHARLAELSALVSPRRDVYLAASSLGERIVGKLLENLVEHSGPGRTGTAKGVHLWCRAAAEQDTRILDLSPLRCVQPATLHQLIAAARTDRPTSKLLTYLTSLGDPALANMTITLPPLPSVESPAPPPDRTAWARPQHVATPLGRIVEWEPLTEPEPEPVDDDESSDDGYESIWVKRPRCG